nr:hypothetical protein [Octadecabacter sp.]
MSDPVANVEIEDVLSSIRRLVSDGDKARTRDPAPIEADNAPAQNTPEIPAETSESKLDKFVLTPAFLVVDNHAVDVDSDVNDDVLDESHDQEEWVEEIPQEAAPEPQPDAEIEDGPLPLTDMVWESVNDARKVGLAAVPADAEAEEAAPQTPDRSELVATIAELEAAISNDIEDFEPDGTEDAGDFMGETIAWPGAEGRNFENVQDAEEATAPAPEFNPDLEADDASLAFEHRTAEGEPEQSQEAEADVEPDAVHDEDDEDDYGDDDLDG